MAVVLMASAVISAGAVAGRAYSIGGEFHNGDDVRSACDYFGLCGYSSWYSTNPTYSYLNSSYVLNSDIFQRMVRKMVFICPIIYLCMTAMAHPEMRLIFETFLCRIQSW